MLAATRQQGIEGVGEAARLAVPAGRARPAWIKVKTSAPRIS